MHMGYGGNPYGPAGTGKTESVKALGQALGRQVLVFNCDEGIDFKSMGRIFVGLLKSGAWGCFDEFNRLKEDQLSAISQQIQVIQAAIKEKQSMVKLLDRDVDVDFNAGIFVTMNPAGKGYGGRSKLPDNLKQLFRPVAMSKPDNDLIAEVILYSEGFTSAKDLGRKLVSIYSLSNQLLSSQQHYDWGLRAMKAVLVTGGKLIQSTKKSGTQIPPELEAGLLIRALRVNTLSKLTFEDNQRFLALIGDVFPGIESRDIEYEALDRAIREVMTSPTFNLVVDETQIRKMLQLKESLDQRMGCIIVGPSGCGKSTIWRVLKAAMEKVGVRVITHVMNPKSMPRERLLGIMDNDTREWTDGVLTAAARKVVVEPPEVRSWIVCDGDVDPEWIESLNSVLDDNRLLTMPNGERISFPPNVNFLFETHDLQFASPATISRMGMIYLSDEDVDVKRLVSKWLTEQEEDLRMTLQSWMDDLFYRALDWVLRTNAFVVSTTMVGIVLSGLSHCTGVKSRGEFVCGVIRGLGANLFTDVRTQFAKEVFNWAGERPADIGAPLDSYYHNGSFHSYVIKRDAKDDGQLDENDLERGAVVQTVSFQRNVDIVRKWIENMEPFIVVGPEGCGKSMLIKHLIKVRKASMTVLHCNAQTTAEHVIQKLNEVCLIQSTNTGRVYRPRDGERLVLFLKDINLPKPDKYDTCMLIAFLQQLITFKGFYNEELEFLGLERIHVIATMSPATTVGRHVLSTRFTAIVRIAYIDYPDKKELSTIYSTFLEAAIVNSNISDSQWRQSSTQSKLATSMVELVDQVRSKFSIDDHRHYLTTPRDLTKWVISLLRYDMSTENILDVWAYEASRIFRDRLVDAEAEARFDSLLNSILRSHWNYKPSLTDVYYSSLLNTSTVFIGGKEEEKEEEKTVHGDVKIKSGHEGCDLLRVDQETLRELVAQKQVEFERECKELNALLFSQVLDNIARIDRVLSVPGGSLLLVGRSGVGRRTNVTLAAYILNMEFFSPNLPRDYGTKQFLVDLKQLLQRAGVQGDKVVLFMEDYQLVEDSFLETLNSLLSSGEVPGLFSHEELEPMLSPLKEIMSQAGGFNYRSPYEFFVSRVRSNLHIVLSMDSTHPRFRSRCESNPALFTKCSILWMGQWHNTSSRPSLRQVPQMMLSNLLERIPDASTFMDYVIMIQESCEPLGAAPRQFVSLLQNYHKLYESKYGSVEQAANRLKAGLAKINDAAIKVDEMSRKAVEKEAKLREMQHSADDAMTQITSALSRASERRAEMEKLQQDLGKAESDAMGQKNEIETQLSEVTPLLEEARSAVNQIRSEHLSEIRSVRVPVKQIQDVLEGVLRLLGNEDTSWQSMKSFLGSRGVKEQILNFDARDISPTVRDAVARLVSKKAASFEQEAIERVSLAAAPLAAWVKANIRYSEVLERIHPLEEELTQANHILVSSRFLSSFFFFLLIKKL